MSTGDANCQVSSRIRYWLFADRVRHKARATNFDVELVYLVAIIWNTQCLSIFVAIFQWPLGIFFKSISVALIIFTSKEFHKQTLYYSKFLSNTTNTVIFYTLTRTRKSSNNTLQLLAIVGCSGLRTALKNQLESDTHMLLFGGGGTPMSLASDLRGLKTKLKKADLLGILKPFTSCWEECH